MRALLRLCLSSLLILCIAINTTAQRTSRRRAAVSSEQSPSPTTSLQDSVKSKELVYRCGLRVTPGELFSKADLVRSQKESANLKFPWMIEDTIVSKSIPLTKDRSTIEKKKGIPDCRETKAINKADTADSYPYITEDGLRLYFTSNREGGHGRFFISTRKSVKDPFGEPIVLSKTLTDGYYAGTLTADELTLCMVKSGAMYISIRKNKTEEFPVPVKLTGATTDYHFGPSISADGKEIIVTVSPTGNDRSRLYKRTGTYHVEAGKELPAPVEGEGGPGQFSKDGLYYYLSIETKTSEHLWRYCRASLSDNFSKLEELPVQMKGLTRILQPSLNKDGSVMMFVTAFDNVWDADDILLVNHFKKEPELPKLPDNLLTDVGTTLKMPVKPSMPQLIVYPGEYTRKSYQPEELTVKTKEVSAGSNNLATTGKIIPNPALVQSKVYPNPFTSIVHIEVNDLPVEGAFFDLYDISGKKIQQVKINTNRTTISLDQLIRGIYSFNIVNRKGELISSGKLVKIE